MKIPSYLPVFFIYFLSDCGPSTAVANTLYHGGNKNLCVCPAQLRAGAGPGRWGGGSKVISDLCHALQTISLKNTLFSMASPFKVLYDLHSGGKGSFQIFCLYILVKAIKHHSTKKFIKLKSVTKTFSDIYVFFF